MFFNSPLLLLCMDSPGPLLLAPSRRLGGTYFPVAFAAGAAGAAAVPGAAGAPPGAASAFGSFVSSSWRGPSVSLYGQRVVQWSPLQIRQETSFWPLSFASGSSSTSCAWAFWERGEIRKGSTSKFASQNFKLSKYSPHKIHRCSVDFQIFMVNNFLNSIGKCFSQDLETEYPKLVIDTFFDILFFRGDLNPYPANHNNCCVVQQCS